MKKELLLILFAFLVVLSIIFILGGGLNIIQLTEWPMEGLNPTHTGWDGNNYSTILGLNNLNVTISSGTPIIVNGFIYLNSPSNSKLYQLNASNISQQIASFSLSSTDLPISSPTFANGYIYIGSKQVAVLPPFTLYQLNASNISQQIATYPLYFSFSPTVANGYVYVGSDTNSLYQLNASDISQLINSYPTSGKILSSPAISNDSIYFESSDYYIYQLNLSNISQQIANYSFSETPSILGASPTVANGYVYIAPQSILYQLNASNISQQIANYSCSGTAASKSSAVTENYVYSGCNGGYIYQLNASNISQQIANFSQGGEFSPTVANGYVYVGGNRGFYQLNASNISQQIANLTVSLTVSSSTSQQSTASSFYVYFTDANANLYQLNATNISLQNVCFESWSCSAWSDCSGGIQTRTCSDANACGTTADKPVETQTCSTGGHTVPVQSQGGGGGGSVTIYKPIVNVSSSEPVQITLNNTKMDLTGITLILKKSVENASMNITKVNQNEFLLFGLPIGKLYQLFQIEPLGIQYNDILNATLDFKINKTFLEENNITFHHKDNRYWLLQNDIVGNIAVYRMPTGSSIWMPLITNYTGEDDNAYYFKSSTPGFSTFAIFFNKYDCLPNSARCADNNVQLCLGNATWLVTDHCSDTCDNGKCTVSFYKSGQFKFLIGTILTGIFAIVLIRVIHNRRAKNGLSRKQRKEIRKNKRKIRKEMRKKR